MSPVLATPPLANGDLSRDSMEVELETPLSAGPLSEAPLPPPTNARRAGKKKKKRGRKARDKTQVDNSTIPASVGAGQGGADVQQPPADMDNRALLQTVGGVSSMQGVVHSGDDVLRTSREQMEIENSVRVGSMLNQPANPHAANNFGGSHAQPVSEPGQTGLTERSNPSSLANIVARNEVATPPRRDSTSSVLPLGVGGVVRVKQEPITNHEDEMDVPHHHVRPPATKVRDPHHFTTEAVN